MAYGDRFDGRYVSVLTYRRDATATACPVWSAHDGDRLVFRTFDRTVKARRLSRDRRVGLAPCDRDGNETGPYAFGTAVLLTGPEARRASWRLFRRQGLLKPLADLYYRPRLGRLVTYAVDLRACADVPAPHQVCP